MQDQSKETSCSSASQVTELQKELADAKDKLNIITQKFVNSRKERDQAKKESKELQEEIIQLQSNMRHMIPCFSNTSSNFPMMNEIQNITSEFYKCECQDVFFDLLSPELNLDGVVYFFQHILPVVQDHIQKYFLPSNQTILKVACLKTLDGPIMNVLKKVYQQNWKEIQQNCFPESFAKGLMNRIQNTLSIGDEQADVNDAILEFIQKTCEICFQLAVSEPTLVLDNQKVGKSVAFSSFNYESIDGFIKNGDECLIILPAVYKSHLGGEMVIKAHVLPTNYEFP